jgi:hypothetical protein
MQSQVEIEEVDPSYNGDVVAESNALATTLDQYWLERRALSEQSIERNSVAVANTAAERDWQSFCSRGAGFLNKYLAKATDSIDAPLRQFWRCSFAMAREARKVFEKEASAEIWIPCSRDPLRFVRVSSSNGTHEIRESPNAHHPESFELGRAYVAVRWSESYLFLILPSQTHVTLNSFTFTKNGHRWNSEEVIPKVFAAALADYRPQLEIAEHCFAPVQGLWQAREKIARANDLSSASKIPQICGEGFNFPMPRSSISFAEWSCSRTVIQRPHAGFSFTV